MPDRSETLSKDSAAPCRLELLLGLFYYEWWDLHMLPAVPHFDLRSMVARNDLTYLILIWSFPSSLFSFVSTHVSAGSRTVYVPSRTNVPLPCGE